MMTFSRKHFFGCRPDRLMKTMTRIVPLGAVCLALTLQAATLNEWNFYSDPDGTTLSNAYNSVGTASFSLNAGTDDSLLAADGVGNLLCTQNDPGTLGMWTNGAILDAALPSPVTTGAQFLRYDFSYDLSSTSNDSGCVASFAFYDGTSNKVAGVALQYDVGANTNPTYQVNQLTELTNTVGTISVVAKIDLTNQTLSVWYDLTGDVSGFSESSPATNVAVSLTSFDSLRFQATGDIQPAGSTDKVSVGLLRTADSFADAVLAAPVAPAEKYSNEWTFERDVDGRPLSDAINSGTNSPLAQFSAGFGSTVFITNRALRCVGEDSGTDGVWTNGAVLDAALTSTTSGVHYLRYDVAYDLSSTSNNSGTVLGVYFTGDSGAKAAGLVMKYDTGNLTNSIPVNRTLTPVPGATNIAKVGRLTAIAEVDLDNDTLKVWYDLSGSNVFVQGSPVFATNTTMTAIDNLQFHATGDIQPAGSSNFAEVDNIRQSGSWGEIIESLVDMSAPPQLQGQVTDSLFGSMDVGETNIVSVVISNIGGPATDVTSVLSHNGSLGAFSVTSNNTASALATGASITNTYILVANTNGLYSFAVQVQSAETNSPATNFDIIVGSQISYLTNSVSEVSGGIISNKYEPGEIIDITVTSTNDGAKAVSNIVNSVSANPSFFTISNLTASTYLSMPIGAVTSTVYRVVINPAATNGTYWFSVTNRSDTKVWTNSFPLNVFSQGIPSVSPASITLNVLPGATVTNTEVTVTNAGNSSITFSITDNGAWGVSYVPTTGSSAYAFVETAITDIIKLNDPDTNSVNIEAATDGVSTSQSIGFGFPFNGMVYSNFYVTADGYIGLSNTTNIPAKSLDQKTLPAAVSDPLIAPFWGELNSPTGSVRVIRQYDYLVVSYVGVSKISGETNLQFQTALYTNGAVEFRYKNIAGVANSYGVTNVTIGIQSSAGSYTNLSFTPGKNTQIKLTPQQNRWVSYTPSQNVTVGPQSSQVITFVANAAGKAAGTSTAFNAGFIWSTGGSNVVAVTANVTNAVPVYSAVSSLSFTGAAGQVTSAPFVISNIGTGPLSFSISNAASASAGFITTNPPYSWVDISLIGNNINLIDPDTSPYITAEDEGSSAMIPIGFAFPFYGGSYTQLSVSANGAVRFDTIERIRVLQNIASTNSVMPVQMIAPYWGELAKDAGATLKYHATADRFVITWENFRQYGVGGGSNLTFQAMITPSGDITFQYKKLEGSPWPKTIIGLRDTATRTQVADIRQPEDGTVTNTLYSETVYTQYVGVVSNRTVQFQSTQIQTIRYTPGADTIPAGGSAEITIIGDASGLSAGGPNPVVTNATLTITHDAVGSPATLAVTFTATNSQETVFARASALADDSDGDGLTDDAERIAGSDPQDAGSVFALSTSSGRELSWPIAEGRTYTVLYALNLKDGFRTLDGASHLSTNSFIDIINRNVPVIYYKVIVD